MLSSPVAVTEVSGGVVSAVCFPTMEKSLRVLMLENSEADAELIKHELSRAGLAPITKRVDSEEAFASALREFDPELVLSDHSLTHFDARAAIRLLRKLRPTTPLIEIGRASCRERTV